MALSYTMNLVVFVARPCLAENEIEIEPFFKRLRMFFFHFRGKCRK
jgi:hypothetical protein